MIKNWAYLSLAEEKKRTKKQIKAMFVLERKMNNVRENE